MSRAKVFMTAVAGAGLIGATVYATRKSPNQTASNRNKTQERRDPALGGNADRVQRQRATTAESGSPGGGGSGARKSQVSPPGSSPGVFGGDMRGDSKNESIIHQATGLNLPSESPGWFSSVKSTVGGKSTATRKDAEGVHDTRGISKMGSETPSKRGPADASD